MRDDGVEVEHARLQYLPPAERKELARERRGTLGGGGDLLEIGAQPVVCAGELAQGEPRPPGDDRQQVVEVVRHTAGELPHRLQPL